MADVARSREMTGVMLFTHFECSLAHGGFAFVEETVEGMARGTFRALREEIQCDLCCFV